MADYLHTISAFFIKEKLKTIHFGISLILDGFHSRLLADENESEQQQVFRLYDRT